MIFGPENLFALPDIGALLREELDLVPAHAARQPAGRALVIQACSANRSLDVDTRHLVTVRCQVEGARLAGDVLCAPSALPWEDDAFRLVLAQHAGDVLPESGGFIDELARVLAPGGMLLWFGLNPWSPWLAWAHWQARSGLALPRTRHADFARRRLLKRQLAPVSLDYLGSFWPEGADAVVTARSPMFAPLRGSYLLAASKQRAMLTPLRPRMPRARVAFSPQLVGSRRSSA